MSSLRHNSSGDIPQNGRIAIVAGSGSLPNIVAKAIVAQGREPVVIMLEGEADPILKKYDHETISTGDFAGFLRIARGHDISAVVLAGGIARRPGLFELRLSFGLLRGLPRFAKVLTRGDDSLLRAVINAVESYGFKVIGAHEIVPDIVVDKGAITRRKPAKSDWNDINSAIAAAQLLGKIDVGQGAVSIGGRVVALEGAEGTEAMLSRVAEMRTNGRISATKPGVLVKCLKPGQEVRVDMPAIGEDTVNQVKRAGLSGIVLEAGSTLVLDYQKTVSRADELKLYIYGHVLDHAE